MKIVHGRPIRARRERICVSDEATVSRILSPGKYEGMVERLQVGRERDGSTFSLMDLRTDMMTFLAAPSRADYHILKFLSLAFARSLFPENFVESFELRVFPEEGGMRAATYSWFVPDGSGVIQRRKEAMEGYYGSVDGMERQSIKLAMDMAERKLNPSLMALAYKCLVAGIRIPHPEANYHSVDGRTVFFEVDALDMRRALAYCDLAGNREALALLSQIYTIALRVWSSSLALDHLKDSGIELYRRLRFRDIRIFVNHVLSADDKLAHRFLDDGPEALKRDIELWLGDAERDRGAAGAAIEPGMPVSMDRKCLALFSAL